MRSTWLFCAVALAACDSTYRQVGPGEGGGSTPTTLGGDDDDDSVTNEGSTRSCDRRSEQGFCEEYVGEGWDVASIAADCSGADDLPLTTTCPLSDIGGCDETRENPQGTIVWYYQGDFFTATDVGVLQSECTTSYYTWVN